MWERIRQADAAITDARAAQRRRTKLAHTARRIANRRAELDARRTALLDAPG